MWRINIFLTYPFYSRHIKNLHLSAKTQADMKKKQVSLTSKNHWCTKKIRTQQLHILKTS